MYTWSSMQLLTVGLGIKKNTVHGNNDPRTHSSSRTSRTAFRHIIFLLLFLPLCCCCFRLVFLFSMLSLGAFVDVLLIFSCPTDHASDWQPRIVRRMVEALLYQLVSRAPTRSHTHICRQGAALAGTQQLRSQGPVPAHAHCAEGVSRLEGREGANGDRSGDGNEGSRGNENGKKNDNVGRWEEKSSSIRHTRKKNRVEDQALQVRTWHHMLCYAMLCYAMLCYAILYYTILYTILYM